MTEPTVRRHREFLEGGVTGYLLAAQRGEIILPIKTVSEMNSRDHWRRKHRRGKRQKAAAMLLTPAHPLPCVVTLTRLSTGTLDDDNLRCALKATRDGIAAKLGADDSPSSPLQFRYAQEKCRRGEYGVRVEISPAG